jgi:hypothetical protein
MDPAHSQAGLRPGKMMATFNTIDARKAARCDPVLTDFNLDILVCIASSLDLQSLGRLACVAQRFSSPIIISAGGAKDAAATAVAATRSVIGEAARLLVGLLPQQQQDWVPLTDYQHSSDPWMQILRDVERLRRPLVFSRRGSKVKVKGCEATAMDVPYAGRLVVCTTHTMRAGVHYAEVTLAHSGVEPDDEGIHDPHIFFGVSTPTVSVTSAPTTQGQFWGIESSMGLFVASYDNYEGEQIEVHSPFPGHAGFDFNMTVNGSGGELKLCKGDTIGLRVDMDRGNMTVYKNRRRLGVAFGSLQGAASMWGRSNSLCFAVGVFNNQYWTATITQHAPPSISAAELVKEEAEARTLNYDEVVIY